MSVILNDTFEFNGEVFPAGEPVTLPQIMEERLILGGRAVAADEKTAGGVAVLPDRSPDAVVQPPAHLARKAVDAPKFKEPAKGKKGEYGSGFVTAEDRPTGTAWQRKPDHIVGAFAFGDGSVGGAVVESGAIVNTGGPFGRVATDIDAELLAEDRTKKIPSVPGVGDAVLEAGGYLNTGGPNGDGTSQRFPGEGLHVIDDGVPRSDLSDAYGNVSKPNDLDDGVGRSDLSGLEVDRQNVLKRHEEAAKRAEKILKGTDLTARVERLVASGERVAPKEPAEKVEPSHREAGGSVNKAAPAPKTQKPEAAKKPARKRKPAARKPKPAATVADPGAVDAGTVETEGKPLAEGTTSAGGALVTPANSKNVQTPAQPRKVVS